MESRLPVEIPPPPKTGDRQLNHYLATLARAVQRLRDRVPPRPIQRTRVYESHPWRVTTNGTATVRVNSGYVLDQQGTDDPAVVDAELVSAANLTATNGTGGVWLRVPVSSQQVHISDTTELDGIEPTYVQARTFTFERSGSSQLHYLAAGSAPTAGYDSNSTGVSNVWTQIATVTLAANVATVSAQIESSNFRLAKLHFVQVYEM